MRTQIAKATDGLLSTVTDTILFLFFLQGASFGKHGPRGIYQSFEEAQLSLTDINYQTIKRAINSLTQEKFIQRSGKRIAPEIGITSQGKDRISRLFPIYKTQRPWDGHVYLISYDIPNTSSTKRDMLRQFIRKTGGALLQESLWVNPYNPIQLIEEFTQTHGIQGSILISKLGHDGAIGNESLLELISRIYALPALAKKYTQFIQSHKMAKSSSPIAVSCAYHAILKEDPQLPFQLLPRDFPSKNAHELFTSLLSTYIT